MYTALVSNVLFPLHERLKRHTSAARRHDLERTQWFDRSRLEALRIERLRGFLTAVGRVLFEARVAGRTVVSNGVFGFK